MSKCPGESLHCSSMLPTTDSTDFCEYIVTENTFEKKRSTPRAQTSATPSLKSAKQSIQAWNSVAYCFLCPYPENFMKVHPSGITWCWQQTRTQKIEKRTLCPRGETDHPQNVPDCSLCHSQHILKISWKSTYRFYRGVDNEHTRDT